MAVDLSVFERLKTKADFDRAEEEWQLKKQLAGAEIKKASYLDVDKLGEQAFMKAAQGLELSPQELAAAQFIDAKSGGISFNPATGEMIQKPRISEKIGLPGGLGKPEMPQNQTTAQNFGNHSIPPISYSDLGEGYGPVGNNPPPPPLGNGGPIVRNVDTYMPPKSQMDFNKNNMEADRKRVDALIESATGASAGASAAERMQSLQPRLGYTGTGGDILGALDKPLTAMGAGDWISGDPAAREAFQKEGVQAWVDAVTPLKGALSNTEGSRFDRAISNLTTTPEGIRLRGVIANAMSKRANEKSQFFQDWYYQNGSLQGADEVWEDYASKNPVITDEMVGTKQVNRKSDFSSIPMSAVQYLKQNPDAASDFDAKYGQGASAEVLGR